MASFYDRMQATTKRLIKQFEQGTVIYNEPGGEADPFNPAPAGTPHPVSAVQAPASEKKTYVDGGYIVATDILLAVAPFDVEPTQSGTMSVNGEVFQVVMVDSPTVLEPDGQLVWRVGLRK